MAFEWIWDAIISCFLVERKEPGHDKNFDIYVDDFNCGHTQKRSRRILASSLVEKTKTELIKL